jgi:hypothetical protein
VAYIAAVLGFSLSFFVLFRIAEAFSAVTGGLQPFDMQNGLRVEEVPVQLSRYTDASRRLYALFAVVDYLFPLAGGFFVASSGAFLLRHGVPAAYAWLESRRGLVVFFLPTLFDWLENVAAIAVIFPAAPPSSAFTTLLIVFKKLKLGSLFLSQGTLVLLALWLGVRKAVGLVRSSRRP